MTRIQKRLATGKGKFTPLHPELGTAPVSYEDCISPEFFAAEREAVFERSWLYVGRIERLPRPGTYFTRELPGRLASLVVARDLDGSVHAFHNVCAHRGNKVVWQEHPQRETSGACRRRFDRNRMNYFHYMLYAHSRGKPKELCITGTPAEQEQCKLTDPNYHVPSSSSGVSDLPGGDGMVTLGQWGHGFVGSVFVQASTTMHELGHSLWRSHGGDPVPPIANCKSNYLSAMNYLFQLGGLRDDDEVLERNADRREPRRPRELEGPVGAPSGPGRLDLVDELEKGLPRIERDRALGTLSHDEVAERLRGDDLEGLGEAVRADVKGKFGIELEWEIKRIGRPG